MQRAFGRQKLCETCNGVGRLQIGTQVIQCESCKGTGIVYRRYNNTKVWYNGEQYDSKKEAAKAEWLDYQKSIGAIESWRPHPKFVVMPRFKKDGKLFRPILYIADFEVKYPDGRVEIIDIKGMKTEVFKLKMKLWNYKYQDSNMRLIIE